MATVEQFEKLLGVVRILVEGGTYKEIEKLGYDKRDDCFVVAFDDYHSIIEISSDSLDNDTEELSRNQEKEKQGVEAKRKAREARRKELSEMDVIKEWESLNLGW